MPWRIDRRSHCSFLGLVVLAAGLSFPAASQAADVDLLIVAGQSNAVGYDAKPNELPQDMADGRILFWWRCGDPPPDEHDTTSSGKWTTLQPQPLGNPKRPKQDRQYGNFAQPEGGFGPEMGLARTLYAKEQKPLAVVKVAFSGTSVMRDWNHADSGENGACYRALIEETRAAIAAAKEQKGITLRPRAFAWIQGESDANDKDAENYARNLGGMLQALRHDLEAPKLLTLIAVNTKFGGGKNRFLPTIVQQQKRLAASDPRCEYVETSSATITNPAHFDSQGTLEVGRLFAEALQNLEAKLRPAKRPFTIVTLGDSITKGVRSGVTAQQTFASLLEAQLNEKGILARVINVGVGGERTDQALKRMDQVISLQPDFVTVMYGTNDSYVDQGKTASRISVEEYRKNLTAIVTELSSRGIRPLLMTEPRWADDARPNGLGENPNTRLVPFVEACRQTARLWRVPLVDHFSKWTQSRDQGAKLRDWTTDGCHPNPAGHQEIVKILLPAVQEAIGPELKTRQKLLAGEAVRVVCFGDSVTGVYYHTGSRRAYTDLLGIALRRVSPQAKVHMINAGISGHTTVNALSRIDRDVLRHKPDLVTVMFGLNDMTRVPLEEYRANLKAIVEKCRAIGSEVVLATPNNVMDSSDRPITKLIPYCDAVREIGRELNVPVCDCYQELEALRDRAAFEWRLIMSDAIHPNMAGHKRLATALAQTITGLRISLEDVPPSEPAIPKTLELLSDGKPLQVLAMPPMDQMIKPALRELSPQATVKVEVWPVKGLSLAQIEQDAKSRVRRMKPDLVLIAIPRTVNSDSEESFVHSYAWIMNSSLNFGPPTWDCLVVHPAVFHPDAKRADDDELIRRLVKAQDLSLIDRPKGDTREPAVIVNEWFKRHQIIK